MAWRSSGSATYVFRARIASTFRVGPVFLLGDAAHLTPPFIGQGLGAGLRDADNLAWKVAHVRTGPADPTLLDTYDAERRPHATAMVMKAVRVGWAMTGGQDRAAVVRRVVLAAACRSARFRALIADPSTPLLRTGALQEVGRLARGPRHLRVGGLVGNPAVRTHDGAATCLDDVLRRRAAVLTARRPGPSLVDLCRRHGLLLLRVVPAGRGGGGAAAGVGGGWAQAEVIDTRGGGLAALLGDPGLAVLVRPDRVVAVGARRPQLPAPPWSLRPVPSPAPAVVSS